MITNLHSSQNVIRRLRIAGATIDPMLARLRAAMLLNAANLDAAQPTPSAIVVIRKVRDPMPGVLRLDQGLIQPPMEWNRALADELRQLTARAGRPAGNDLTGSEEAIIFADRAELLACLAADFCRGLAARRWWWKTLLGDGDVAEAVKRLWRDGSEYLPAALAQLERQQHAALFLSTLTDADCHDLLQGVIRAFALHELGAVSNRPLVFRAGMSTESGATSLSEASRPPFRVNREPQIPPPWHCWLSDTESEKLSPERQRFLGIALTIQHAPSTVRTRNFASDVERWQKQFASPSNRLAIVAKTTIAERAIESPHTDSQPTSPPVPFAEKSRESPIDYDAKPFAIENRLWSAAAAETIERAIKGVVPDRPFEHRVASKPIGSIAERFDSSPPSCAPPTEIAPSSARTPVHDSAFVEVATEEDRSAISIETNLGGLFYLINLALYLDLYGDFTSPAPQDIELNIWDFVALVGSELVGTADAGDAVWALLANLAGRKEGERAGEKFEPNDEWRLPAEWLLLFQTDQAWKCSAGRGRLRVLHPEGFLVLDLPRATNVREQLQREIEPYAGLVKALTRSRMPKAGPLQRIVRRRRVRHWLMRLMPYVSARLRVALGAESNRDIAAILCRRQARVRATDTHLDVFFDLADLPLEIRFAGLDRDPGWVPAAGRFIAFHFD